MKNLISLSMAFVIILSAFVLAPVANAEEVKIMEICVQPVLETTEVKIQSGKIKKLSFGCPWSIKNWATSDSSIVEVTKNGKIIALKKGTAVITAVYNDYEVRNYIVTVKSDPKLTKNDKTVKSVEVKKGGTVSVKLKGKVPSIKNKYTNTKYAKITSKKNATLLKIKGIKKGVSTVKVKVNGVKTLKLKVNVK